MPDTAAFAEQNDLDTFYAGQYRLFAGLFPGFVMAFFNSSASMGMAALYLNFLIYCGISLGLFMSINHFVKGPRSWLSALFGIAAFNCYYWYTSESFFKNLSALTGQWTVPAAAPWSVRLFLFAASLLWIWRMLHNEKDHYTALSLVNSQKHSQ